ncbi:hypothetical protein CIW52_04295 [Mycolicibacterium sp. P9-64]|nr:hypothetical protein CIW52_04295 [Mycolicibacterium sp. P9-64]
MSTNRGEPQPWCGLGVFALDSVNRCTARGSRRHRDGIQEFPEESFLAMMTVLGRSRQVWANAKTTQQITMSAATTRAAS